MRPRLGVEPLEDRTAPAVANAYADYAVSRVWVDVPAATVVEGESVYLRRDGDLARSLTVDVRIDPGTATATADYEPVTSVTFPAGADKAAVLRAVSDGVPEPAETATVTVLPGNPVGVSASGQYDPAVNALPGVAGWWNTPAYSGWIEFDLGVSHDISGITLTAQMTPNGVVSHRVTVGDSPGGGREVYAYDGYLAQGSVLTVGAAGTARYVRVVTTRSPSWVAWLDVRVDGTPVAGEVRRPYRGGESKVVTIRDSLSLATDAGEYTEGSVATLTGEFPADVYGASPVVVVDWGDGTVPDTVPAAHVAGGKFTAKHYYADDRQPGDTGPGNLTAADVNRIAVTVTGSGNNPPTATADARVTIRNAPPSAVDVRAVAPADGKTARDGKVVITADPVDRSDRRADLPSGVPTPVLVRPLREPDNQPATGWPFDLFDYTIDWADGKPAQTYSREVTPPTTFERDYNAVGELRPGEQAKNVTRQITVTAADDDEPGRAATGTIDVRVRLLPPRLGTPTIEREDGATGDTQEGQTVVLRGEVEHPGPSRWSRVTIDWGDGTTSQATVTRNDNGLVSYAAEHEYLDNPAPLTPGGGFAPPYRIKITAVADGYEDRPLERTVTHRVGNVKPSDLTADLTAAANLGGGAVNRTVRIQGGSFVDPGVKDTHVLEVNWGDGVVDRFDLAAGLTSFDTVPGVTGQVQLVHTYTGDGTYPITLRVWDKDARQGSGSLRPADAAELKLQFAAADRNVLASFHRASQRTVAGNILDGIFSFAGEVIDLTRERATSFVDGVADFYNELSALEGELRKLFGQNLPKVLDALLEDPFTFASRLLDSAKAGFDKFFGTIDDGYVAFGENLKNIVLEWVATKAGVAGLKPGDIPKDSEWQELPKVAGFALTLMELTWDDILAKVTTAAGPDNLAAVMQVYDFVKGAVGNGKDGQANFVKAFDLSKPDSPLSKLLQSLGNADGLAAEIERLLADNLDAETLKNRGVKAAADAVVAAAPGLIAQQLAPLLSPIGGGFKAIQTAGRIAGWAVNNLSKAKGLAEAANVLVANVGALTGPAFGDAEKGRIADAIDAVIKRAGPLVVDFVAKVFGADRLATAVGGAVKRVRDTIHRPIDDALAKVAEAGNKLVARLLDRAVPNASSSPDFRGLIGRPVAFTAPDGTHHLWLRYDAAAGQPVVMLGSLPVEADRLAAAWEAEWAGRGDVLPAIRELKRALAALTRDQVRKVERPHEALLQLAGRDPDGMSPGDQAKLRDELKKYTDAVARYQSAVDDSGRPAGAALAAQVAFRATNGEWGPGHFMSGLKTAELVDGLIGDYNRRASRPLAPLSPDDRRELIAEVRDEGAYGGWGSEVTLARLVVDRLLTAARGAPPSAVIRAAADEYYGHSWLVEARVPLDAAIETDKPVGRNGPRYESWMKYIEGDLQNRDARGNGRNQAFGEYRGLHNANPARYPDPDGVPAPNGDKFPGMHGHHIVFKKGQGVAGQQASKEAKDVLIYYGIDPYFGRENLAYAPQWVHYDASIEYMRNELLAVFGRPTTNTGTITAQLKEFADLFFIRTLRGFPQ